MSDEKMNAGEKLKLQEAIGDAAAKAAMDAYNAVGLRVGIAMFVMLQDEDGLGVSNHHNFEGIDAYLAPMHALRMAVRAGQLNPQELDRAMGVCGSLGMDMMIKSQESASPIMPNNRKLDS